MSDSTFFVRPCPSCGRTAQIRIELLGQDVCCPHCLRQFVARDLEMESAALNDQVQYWAEYTDHRVSQAQDSQADNGFVRIPR